MHIDIKIPSVGESVQEAVLAQWYQKDGQTVRKDDPLFVIETDKVTLEVVAEADGVLKIQTPAEQTVAIGAVVGTIDTSAAPGSEPPAVVPPAAPPAAGNRPPRTLCFVGAIARKCDLEPADGGR